MKILILTTQVPFVRGGAEILAQGLLKALILEDHEAEIISLPFQWNPPERILDSMLSTRLLDLSMILGQKVDRIIGLKFPAYLISHPNKVLWLLHQHRPAYDLWNTPYNDLLTSPLGLVIKQAIYQADQQCLAELKGCYTIAQNVSRRLEKYNKVASNAIYHPPQNADHFYTNQIQDFFFFPSRLTPIKRQKLVLEAISKTVNPIKVIFAGKADHPIFRDELNTLVKKLKILDKVTFLGEISEQEKLKYYAECLAVIYPPYDEDYGYVTLEGMLSKKPIITCTDSGGSTEFVEPGKTGLIVDSQSDLIANEMDSLWENRDKAMQMGKAGWQKYHDLKISWSNVIKDLLS